MVYSVISDVIAARKSIRAFTKQSVDIDILESILKFASRAPSGSNIQPWRVYIARQNQIEEIAKAIVGPNGHPDPEQWDDYKYYPDEWVEPYLSRRMRNGIELYRSLNIARHEKDKYKNFLNQNYLFFGAPVGLILTLDRRFEKGAWIELGMFLQNLLLLAKAKGLDSCPQASFAPYHKVIRPILEIPDKDIVVCGVALGYADQDHPSFQLDTERAALNEWVFGL
jgi:nitroreductase